ncbi:MCE family protein [Nocardioides sambongensis]|uniref:MCE family protein n=1 Tax=Nocardioides sambongensis TaxID=2589074 RepID=UPI001E46B64A|nr:MCE family protein [Nocardioides sambongensis]
MRTLARTWIALVAGAVLLSGCSFDVYEIPLPGGADVGDDPIEVTVQFRDVLDLVPQSSVKVNDVTVGEVTGIELSGNHATVRLRLRNDTGLPDNPTASIRQTSLLGEKFVSLAAPTEGGSGDLGDGDDIPLEDTGRNPEVEEVLGALSLVLNGGGVAQLKTITKELNLALEGREDSARSVLNQVESLVTQLDDRKLEIVDAIESINRLAVTARKHQESIDLALEELPSALDSLETQRADLVKMLRGLANLGNVGTRVIRTVKADTVDALQQLDPVLTQISAAGDSFVNAFSTFLTFPFVDESVGRDPQVARNLHMGDYVNLSADLDLDLGNLGLPDLVCIPFNELPDLPIDDLLDLKGLCKGVQKALQQCVKTPVDLAQCAKLPERILRSICSSLSLDPVCQLLGLGRRNGGTENLTPGLLEGLIEDLGLPELPGLGRVGPGEQDVADQENWDDFDAKYDVDLVRLMSAPLDAGGGAR